MDRETDKQFMHTKQESITGITIRLGLMLLAIMLAPGASAALDCRSSLALQELRDPPTLSAKDRIDTNLTASTVPKCVNGKTRNLKSYIDLNAGTDNRPVGPSYELEVDPKKPGPVLRIQLTNNLDPDYEENKEYDCGHDSDQIDLCTNLHTHGFHVSPKGSTDPSKLQSDFVFITLSPATQPVQYQFDLPADHAPGTHWLHAHLHGSTAPQVKNGMAGALILKGELDKTLEQRYGIDDDKDRTMILAQMSDDSGNALCGKVGGQTIVTSINGQCLPKITVNAGEINRWRFIHAGIDESINLQLVGEGGVIPLNEFARDGITLEGLHSQENVLLQPGYRSDVLVQFPSCNKDVCEYYLNDGESSAGKSLFGLAESRHPIARVLVKGNQSTAMTMPPSGTFKNPYPFVCDPKTFYECAARLAEEEVWFANLAKPGGGTYKTVNGFVYPDIPIGNPTGPSEKRLILNSKNRWKLWVGKDQESDVNHPFHIHVNPIQVYDDEQQFSYWKDTLLVSATDNKGKENAITAVSRYDNFDGPFVLHCHNLSHEDQGMMMKVTIFDSPESALQARHDKSKGSTGHHHH